MTFMFAAFASMVASVLFLVRRDFGADSFAAAVTEVGLVFGAINLITGMIWARYAWGIWWAWDARLTFMLISWLMYGGYLMLRQAIEEPTQRARFSAVLSILTFPGVVITYKAIDWWRTQHPGPVLSIRGAKGGMDPAMEKTLMLNYFGRAAGGDGDADRSHAAGGNAARTRRTAARGSRDIEWSIKETSLTCFTALPWHGSSFWVRADFGVA